MFTDHFSHRNALMKYVLSTNARDERNIAEFVLYHLLVGFDHVLVVDHLSNPPIDLACLPSPYSSRVTVVRDDVEISRGEHGKMRLMNHHVLPFIRANAVGYHMHLDADEYLRIAPGGGDVHNLIVSNGTPEVLALHWRMFGSSGLVENPHPAGALLPTYTSCDTEMCDHYKSLVSARVFSSPVFRFNHPHWVLGETFTVQGKSVSRSAPFSKEARFAPLVDRRDPSEVEAYICHYWRQSDECYRRRKVNRPRDDTGTLRTEQERAEQDLGSPMVPFTEMAEFYNKRMAHILGN